MTEFDKMLYQHIEKVERNLIILGVQLDIRSDEHDKDKFTNKNIYNVYNKHFPILKKLPFGSDEYRAYEKEHFKEAHYLHNQQRHQFYCEEHEADTKVNLIDVAEVICDILASAEQYNDKLDIEAVADIVYNKPTMKNYVSRELILNTIKFMLEQK